MDLVVSSQREAEIVAPDGRLNPRTMVDIYRLMYTSRRIDDREILLKRQQKIFFQVSAPDTKPCRSARPWPCVPDTTGSSPTIAIAHFASPSALPPKTCFCRPSAPPPTPPAAVARCRPTGAPARCTSSAPRPPQPHRCSTPWAAPRPAATSAAIPRPQASPTAQIDYRAFHDVEFHGDEVVLACIGEGSTSARRVLGGAQHRFQPEAPRHLPALKTTATPSACPSK